MAETKRLMITSTIEMMLVRIRKEPSTGHKAMIWKGNKTLSLKLTSFIFPLKMEVMC